jgi:hypothetical protein
MRRGSFGLGLIGFSSRAGGQLQHGVPFLVSGSTVLFNVHLVLDLLDWDAN